MEATRDCEAFAAEESLLDGVPDFEERYQAHLDSCPVCREKLDRALADEQLLDTARRIGDPTVVPLEPAVAEVVERLVREELPSRTKPEIDLSFLRPSDQPELLGTLGVYEVRDVIGSGGMGIVLAAYEPALHRLVALKVLAPELVVSSHARQRFTREVKAAAAVTHENIVAVHGVNEADGVPFIVMQLVFGQSLQARLADPAPLSIEEIVRFGLQTAEGLAAAHAQGLVHRDIKPANLLLEERTGKVLITDFGLARMTDDAGLTQQGVVAGTPEYMSPEQARGETVDARGDLFSLGCVLYTLCARTAPFRGETTIGVLRKVIEEPALPLRVLQPGLPEWLVRFVERLLEKDPEHRFQSAQEVANLLRGYLAHLDHPGKPAPHFGPPQRPGTRHRRWLISACFIGALAVGTALFVALGDEGMQGAGATVGKPRVETPDELPPPDQPAPPPRELAQRLEFPLREGLDKQPLLRPFGPEVVSMMKTDAQGLCFTLPTDRQTGAPVGVESRVSLRGDFEITLAYELLALPDPPPELGAGLSMRVEFDTPNAVQAHLGRTLRPGSQGSVANYSSIGPDGKEIVKRLASRRAKSLTGRLRLVRTGTKLIYQDDDGDGGFQVLATQEFGIADVNGVRVQCNTGLQPKFGVEVRFSSLDLRAEEIIVPTPRELPERVEFKFKDGIDKDPRIRFSGHGAAEMAKTDAQGLHFTVPAGRDSIDQVGVESTVRLRGDFEITVAFDLLALPDPPPEYGAGLDLWVEFETADSFRAQMGRVKNKTGSFFGANYMTKGPDDKDIFKGLTIQRAKAANGELRLIRTGKKLIYQLADGTGIFQDIATKEFGTADVIAVRALCTTGWQTKSGVEVRLINLDLRSEQMPNKDAATGGPAAGPEAGKSRTWLIAVLILGFVGGVLFVGALCMRLFIAKRNRTAGKPSPNGKSVKKPAETSVDPEEDQPENKVETAPPPLLVLCRSCRKKLKIKAELVGKKIKCPKCGHPILVPSTTDGEIERDSS